jgi:hypothetical protein
MCGQPANHPLQQPGAIFAGESESVKSVGADSFEETKNEIIHKISRCRFVAEGEGHRVDDFRLTA